MKPLAVELFCGTFGWSAGWLAAGGRSIGFDLEHLPHHGPVPAGAELVLQDVLTLHGSQFKDASVLFASPPCQKYSWLAMPWSKSKDPENSKAAKALRKEWETNGPDNRLFDACFRIQREAIAATRRTCPDCRGDGISRHRTGCWARCSACNGAGIVTRHIPLIVENVRGAQPWVGRAKANYGSFYLWGDVEQIGNRIQMGPDIGRFGAGLRVPTKGRKSNPDGTNHGTGSWFRIADSSQGDRGQKVPGFRFDGSGRSFQTASVLAAGIKAGHPERSHRNGHKSTAHLTNQAEHGTKQPAGNGDWFSKEARAEGAASRFSSKSSARKAASALIAKIPAELSDYAAWALWPAEIERTA